GAGKLDGASEQQQLFGQRGLARIRVGNNGEGTPLAHLQGTLRIGHLGPFSRRKPRIIAGEARATRPALPARAPVQYRRQRQASARHSLGVILSTRREFTLALTGTAFTGLLGACATTREQPLASGAALRAYGELLADPEGLLDLPRGFSYRVISAYGDRMDDGCVVPDYCDGMGAFALGGSQVALVRNHELQV